MAKLNGEDVLVIESDKDNNITYIEASNGIKKWVNTYELESTEQKQETPKIKTSKKEK